VWVAQRRGLSFSDRAEIATGVKARQGIREIARSIGRDPSIVSREVRRNRLASGEYKPVAADCRAERRRSRPKARVVATDPVLQARVLADLKRSRTPRQIAGRLRLEATDPTVGVVEHSPDAEGRTVSHEAIYRWIYALPKGELATQGILLRTKRTRRKPRKALGERSARIVGMVSIDDRPEDATDRRVPGHWEGDLIIGAAGKSAAATLVERTTRFVVIKALPEGKRADPLADILIDQVNELPAMMRKSLTWDQGTEMARHAALTLATQMPVYFAHPHSPWQRGSNENTNGLIREYLPKGIEIPAHQPYLDSIAEELNDRPRATLGFLTPREAFERLLQGEAVA
jgi:IS30 family transposase